eukprot:TRINITY_DN17870_c0_g1_i3.p4 TRINITY_DN17870_c0_g1~~TRINITY_DN17870_c0_g1_i3.p4  ORF type:complete len:127 (-),score=26.26 TRINITY_DN17870_c0_g1_i3:131-511(-)
MRHGEVSAGDATTRTEWLQPNASDVVSVPCRPLASLLAEAGVTKVDLFVLDVEGGEYKVLSTFDFQVPVDVWLVELDGLDVAKDDSVRRLLRRHGYEPPRDGWDIRHECPKANDCPRNEVFTRRGV